MNIMRAWYFSYSPRDWMDGGKHPSPPHVTLVWTPGCSHRDGFCPPAHSAQGPLSRALSADPALSYQEGGLALSWVPHTDLLLASVEIDATATLSIPLNCQLHLLQHDCSPVQPGEAPAGHSALGPRVQHFLCLRQSYQPHGFILTDSVRQLAGSVQALRDCMLTPCPPPPCESALIPPPWSQDT